MARKKRDEKRNARQLKIDFSNIESLEEFKSLAEEYDVSYSQMAELLIEQGKDAVRDGDLDISEYLTESRVPWLYRFAIDLKKFREDRKKK